MRKTSVQYGLDTVLILSILVLFFVLFIPSIHRWELLEISPLIGGTIVSILIFLFRAKQNN